MFFHSAKLIRRILLLVPVADVLTLTVLAPLAFEKVYQVWPMKVLLIGGGVALRTVTLPLPSDCHVLPNESVMPFIEILFPELLGFCARKKTTRRSPAVTAEGSAWFVIWFPLAKK